MPDNYELFWDLEFMIGEAVAKGDEDLAADLMRRQDIISMELFGVKSSIDFETNEIYDDFIENKVEEIERSRVDYVLPF